MLALVAAPLHAFVLPRTRADGRRAVRPARSTGRATVLPPHGWPFVLVAAAFADLRVRAVRIVGASARDLRTRRHRCGDRRRHRRAVRPRAGAGADRRVYLRPPGPSAERRAVRHRTAAGAFVLLALLGVSVGAAAAFAVMFGMCNGLITIARGAVPLALFGPAGYGHLIGRIALPFHGDAGDRAAGAGLRRGTLRRTRRRWRWSRRSRCWRSWASWRSAGPMPARPDLPAHLIGLGTSRSPWVGCERAFGAWRPE